MYSHLLGNSSSKCVVCGTLNITLKKKEMFQMGCSFNSVGVAILISFCACLVLKDVGFIIEIPNVAQSSEAGLLRPSWGILSCQFGQWDF